MKTDSAQTPVMEWDFSDVPNEELIACCFWEYARESAFIRDVRQRCSDPKWLEMTNSQGWEYVGDDIERIQSIGYPAEVFLRGFFFDERRNTGERHPHAPPITGSFPNPWQSLTETERKHRAHVRSDVEQIPIVPVRLGHWATAKEMARYWQGVSEQQHQLRKAWKSKYLQRDNSSLLPNAPEPPHFEPIRPSMFWGFVESLLVEIAWEHFTDDEIAGYFRKWIKKNRPKNFPAPDGKGKKLNDWRVALNRIGIMRSLHIYTFADNRFPAAFKERGEKFCYAARKSTFEKFHELFPFHSKGEKPISWQTKGRRCKSSANTTVFTED
ncbi:MAG: hypothetical protein ACR2H1_01825 [Limisphaerales bacterium]